MNINSIKKIYSQLKELAKLKRQEKFILNIDKKPKVLNLNIIDSCNSKCTMCNIWRRDEELEISPDQLGLILSNPLYSELTHVGVTGGEPTLRKDLLEVYEKLIKVLPNLIGLSIITNAIKEEDVKSTVKNINNLCKENGIHFSAMVSIDGVNEAHDKVRGVKGNFESAIRVLKYFKNELKIPVAFGATISKINAWDADDLLYYAEKNGIYGRFRIAETINRLYNQNRGKVIRNFDEDEAYNLVIFFEKIKFRFEKNADYKRTYSSIQNLLLGGDRLIGCPYHNNGIVLGSKGQINYCAPQAADIGNGLEDSSLKVYKENFSKKEKIFEDKCSKCIHDYHAPITYKEKLEQIKDYYYKKILTVSKADLATNLSFFLKKIPKVNYNYRVFIFGWYGTETVGDKAILGGILNYYQEKFNGRIEFIIGSLYPFITHRTCKELNIDAKVVSTSNLDLLRYSASSDEVVMGGGPLMDLNELYVPYIGFKVAKKFGKKTTIFGCGIGPLKTQLFSKVVKEICQLSDDTKLRDRKSIEIFDNYNFDKQATFFGDPAKGFIKKTGDNFIEEKENILSCYLRDWTFEYFLGERKDFDEKKMLFELSIANLIKKEADKLNVDRIEFHHMHNFVVGSDDRDFSRYFVDKYFQDDNRVFINKKLSTVDSIVQVMKKSKLNICMRFHSVLFAHTLNTNFVAIDYTLGGKIHLFLEEMNMLENKKTLEDLIENYNEI